ncbi:hypothetical protein ACN08P_23385 (plasmid) [Photobacterium leiognathi subsp. mandapamensis]|uniref:hypothetical protein n=1 Tax=Photobacterium leiognathi TaxID=553611 RepID=UPI003AF37239
MMVDLKIFIKLSYFVLAIYVVGALFVPDFLSVGICLSAYMIIGSIRFMKLADKGNKPDPTELFLWGFIVYHRFIDKCKQKMHKQ